jgi:hypothetical protein
MHKIRKISFVYAILVFFSSCKKFVQVSPPTTELVGASVYGSNATAAAAVTGIYLTMAGNSVGGGENGISALLGLSADEFTLFPGTGGILNEVYLNAQLSTNPPGIWSDLYNLIYQANSAIAGISASTGVTPAMKQQLMGEAEFVRAFCYFYLTNIYGPVPLVLTTNYETNAPLARNSQTEVYRQIKQDLKDAQGLLSDNYLTPSGSTTTERVRPNIATATALLARVYLYTGSYDSAEAEATTIISNTTNYGLVGLDTVFLATSNVNNTEAIWQLEMPDNGFNTPDAGAFLLSYYGGPNTYAAPFIISDSLEYNFDTGDLRAVDWTDSIVTNGVTYYYANKYQQNYTGSSPIEFPTILRVGEQYLIRAEARAQQDNINGPTGALADLNTIRNRAGLAAYAGSTDQASVLAAILRERRFELFTEYGHRWLDLIRTGNVNAVMTSVCPLKGGTWSSTDSLYVIPLSDIQADASLIQNSGYN